MDINTIVCQDTSGNTVEIDLNNLGPVLIFGCSITVLAELYRQYLKRNGPLPLTIGSIKQVFSGF